MKDLDSERILQAGEYSFPYHYLPIPGPECRLTRSWNFAPSYLAALGLVSGWLKEKLSAHYGNRHWEHVDIGCGDGALIYHLSHNKEIAQRVTFSGVDYDQRAIKWAHMFNSAANLYGGDLGSLQSEKFDSASLIEVAEHIPPKELHQFVRKCANLLIPNGEMLVTVPSVAKILSAKHYQHFSPEIFREYFSQDFEIVSIYGFERYNLLSRIYSRLVYRTPLRIDSSHITRYLVSTLGRTFREIDQCGRLLVIVRKKN